MHTKFMSENMNARDIWEDIGVDVRIIMKLILRK
jgi:hypothetical protein